MAKLYKKNNEYLWLSTTTEGAPAMKLLLATNSVGGVYGEDVSGQVIDMEGWEAIPIESEYYSVVENWKNQAVQIVNDAGFKLLHYKWVEVSMANFE